MAETMERLYTAEQVRRLDRCAIDGHGIPGMDLMERAGKAAFEEALRRLPDIRRILVFCGAGNNGGDGYIVARLALERGLEVRLCALKPPSGLSGDAATAAERWLAAGGSVSEWPPGDMPAPDLVFDALLGTGLDREPAGDYGAAVDWINHCGIPVVAIDIPSGLNADTGVAMGRAVRAHLTVTFIGSKRGLYTADGPDHAGEVVFSTLRTPESVRESEPDSGILIPESMLDHLLPPRRFNSHKGSYGWVLGIGGNIGMSGAVRLAGEAALRAGAGKVTLATRNEHAALINIACPELMVRGADSAGELEKLQGQADVVVAGIGLGQDAWAADMLRAAMSGQGTLVLDADGLNLLARWVAEAGAPELPAGRWILTPHPAEAARLLGQGTYDIQSDRVTSARVLADRYQAVVALKGCGTVIAEPGGGYAICPYGNPGMASAGTGDVLAGVLGAMAAQGLPPWEATLAGVLAHALAGDYAAENWGERGMLASDISACLPAVLNPLE